MDAIPSDFPQPSAQSLLGRFLTPEVWQALKGVRTSTGVSLHDCIRSGLAQGDSVIGVYAGDAESVECFGLLFAPLIQALHGGSPEPGAADHGLHTMGQAFPNLDPQGTYIWSTRIRLARNLCGYRWMPTITRRELLEVQGLVLDALVGLEGDLAGSYCAVDHAAVARAGFDGADRFQRAAGICRDWPDGRGVYANATQSLQVWVNEEDHLRIIAMQPGADIDAVVARLLRAYGHLAQALDFQQSPRYGYLASCPSNLGTGLRASFHMHLPRSGNSPAFKALCVRHGLAVRSATGERGAQSGVVYDISNQRRLGLSSAQCLQALLGGVEEIIALEKGLQP
jgi:protein-arginine kinase